MQSSKRRRESNPRYPAEVSLGLSEELLSDIDDLADTRGASRASTMRWLLAQGLEVALLSNDIHEDLLP
jgi:hypothetical protein